MIDVLIVLAAFVIFLSGVMAYTALTKKDDEDEA